jgi:hypothetical protein
MATKDRKPREEIDATKIDLLKPINVFELGGKEDPCFGKHHDLKAPECMECGDSEFCAIVKAQNLHQERATIESSQRFKDVEEAQDNELKKKAQAKKLIEDYMAKGFPRLKTVIRVARETNLTKDIVKSLYDKI